MTFPLSPRIASGVIVLLREMDGDKVAPGFTD